MYSVKEIYKTIQGEGAQAGRTAVFVRFSGCNLWTGKEQHKESSVCNFCDTDFLGVDGQIGIYANIIDKINKQEFVFFTKGDKISTLNKVMLYIAKNEHTQKIKIVSVIDANSVLPKDFKQQIKFLDNEYPEISIEYIEVKGNFSPTLIKQLSEKWDIPINFMFIGSPSYKFPYRVEEFGGVRLII